MKGVDLFEGSVTEGLIEKIKKRLSEIEKMVSISENLELDFCESVIGESEKEVSKIKSILDLN